MGISNRETHGADRPGPSEIWRTWLITGARAHGIDRRRVQGEHRGLKQILAEGGEAGVQNRPWKDFSRAMARQSVNQAMGGLSSQERVVVRLAYFAGFSNQEIADELGMTARGVQRVLRQAIDNLSSLMERGRRAALALLLVVSGKRVAQWAGAISSPAATQVVVAAVVVGGLASAPVVDANTASAPAATQAVRAPQPAHAVQALQRADPAPRSASPAESSQASSRLSAAPAIGSAIHALSVTAPALPLVKPPITVPKLRTKLPPKQVI